MNNDTASSSSGPGAPNRGGQTDHHPRTSNADANGFARQIIDSAVDPVYCKDPKGRFLFVNNAMERLLGSSAKEIIGKTATDIFEPATADFLAELDNETLHENLVKAVKDIRIRGRSCRFHFIQVPVRDDHNAVVVLCGIIRDVTDLLRSHEEFHKAERLESLGILSGGIAHDFNNLLGGVFGFIDMAKEYGNPTNTIREYLDKAMAAFNQARDLTQQLLTFSKGSMPVRKRLALNTLLHQSVSEALHGSNINPVFDVPDDAWDVEADERQLRKVIYNIVLNARQAMPSEGVVEATIEHTTLDEKAGLPVKDGRYCCVTIRDQGIGISPSLLCRVFDPFFTTKQDASGLGLATAFSIVQKHDGHITVDSFPGRGTIFRIYLPAAAPKTIKTAEELMPAKPMKPGSVLLMDDEDVIIRMGSEMIRRLGYTVECARDGAETLQIFHEARERNTPFETIILDLTIPGGMGGKETVEAIRKIDPQAYVVVSSGYSEDPILSMPREYGFNAVLKKPYRITELAGVLRRDVQHPQEERPP